MNRKTKKRNPLIESYHLSNVNQFIFMFVSFSVVFRCVYLLQIIFYSLWLWKVWNCRVFKFFFFASCSLMLITIIDHFDLFRIWHAEFCTTHTHTKQKKIFIGECRMSNVECWLFNIDSCCLKCDLLLLFFCCGCCCCSFVSFTLSDSYPWSK